MSLLDKCGPICLSSPSVVLAMADALASSHPQLAATLLEELARSVRGNAYRAVYDGKQATDPDWSAEIRGLLDLHATLTERARRLRG